MKRQDLSAFKRIAGKAVNDNTPLPGLNLRASARLVDKVGASTSSVMRVAMFGGGVAMLGIAKQANDHDVEATAANKPPPAG
jgi:hypothetical protein